MMKVNRLTLFTLGAVLLSGCHDEDPSSVVTPPDVPAVGSPAMDLSGRMFTTRIENNTAGQPFSAPLVLEHNEDYNLFQFGMQASVPLEHLTEGGDNQPLMDTVSDENDLFNAVEGSGAVAPGSYQNVILMLTTPNSTHITVAGMLVNTNDAFFAQKIDVSSLAVGESIHFDAPILDSGTEDNTETALTIPGPAGNGVGFAPQRNDVNRITVHRGVISQQDGLVGSVLNATERLLNSPAKISITRVD